eukprot:1447843-Rhodomonas_salina.2
MAFGCQSARSPRIRSLSLKAGPSQRHSLSLPPSLPPSPRSYPSLFPSLPRSHSPSRSPFLPHFLPNSLTFPCQVNILSGRYTRHGLPQGWEELTTRRGVAGSQLPVVVDAVRCKGKFIYFLCTPVASDNVALSLWNTLAMSGKWTFRQDKDCR